MTLRESNQGLADLCRLCSNPHRESQKTLRRLFLRNRAVYTLNFVLPAITIANLYTLSLAGRAVFQMDQAASQDQGLLRHHRECSQNSDMDRHLGLCSRGHCEEDLESGPKSLHNSTDSEPDPFRENAYFPSTFKFQLHKPGGLSKQPIESIQLTLGQR
jgi:hypothetical protein